MGGTASCRGLGGSKIYRIQKIVSALFIVDSNRSKLDLNTALKLFIFEGRKGDYSNHAAYPTNME